jgi:uncharacterized protein
MSTLQTREITWYDAAGSPSTEWTAGQTRGLLRAGPNTDHYVDPREIDPPLTTSPLLLTDPGPGPFQFAATVRVQNRALFDAITLFVYDGPRTWAKYAIERSPAGEDLLTTVITRGVSDDANGPAVDPTHDVWLRISRVGKLYGFHDSPDGRIWALRRLFTLGDTTGHRVGFSIQSPNGDGLTGTVTSSQLVETELKDFGDGS